MSHKNKGFKIVDILKATYSKIDTCYAYLTIIVKEISIFILNLNLVKHINVNFSNERRMCLIIIVTLIKIQYF